VSDPQPSSADVDRRIELALQMLQLGAWVFPLAANAKIPLLARRHGGKGFLDANGNADMARTFLSNPGHPNYGVVFPEGSDIIVLDLDGGDRDKRPGWQQDWQRLYERLGPPGLTYIVRTPSGGRHAYYRWRTDLYGPIPAGDEMLGWTVRKPWKGYLVGPGSIVNGQTYEPVGLPTIADLPEAWARATLDEKPATRKADDPSVITISGPGQVQVGGRHRYLRDKARYLVGIGVTGEALFAAVMDLNRQLSEPKTEDEVRRAIGDAETKFEADPIDPETGETITPRRDGRPRHGPAQVLELPFYSARTVAEMTQEEIDWAWRDYLAFGTIVELLGPPKAGKTTLVFTLLRALVAGQPFLDRPTVAGAVVVLTEQGPTSLRAAVARAGLADSEDVHFLFHRDARGSQWQDVVETAIQHCRSVGARVLVIDTLPVFASLSGDMENNAGDALEAMQPLLGAAGEGLAVLVNRHRRKGGAPDIADEGRGSGAFSGTVDVILSLRRKEGGSRPTVRILAAASRFDETPEELYVELDESRYVVLGDDAAVETAEAREAILVIVSGHSAHSVHSNGQKELAIDSAQSDGGVGQKESWTVRELVDETGKSRQTVQRVLDDLVRTGDLERAGKGRKGDPGRYALADPGIVSAQTPTPYGGEVNGGSGQKTNPDPTVRCHYFTDHQTRHVRRKDGSFFCPICYPEAA
jgi:hypothetical protein